MEERDYLVGVQREHKHQKLQFIKQEVLKSHDMQENKT